MKRFLMYGALAVGLILTGCLHDFTEPRKPDGGRLTLRLTVDDIGGTQTSVTRATVPAVAGEEDMDELTLLFFEYSTSGTGRFVTGYQIDDPASGDVIDMEIGYGKGVGLSNTENYSILAYANIDDYYSLDSPDDFDGMTQAAVEASVLLGVEAGTAILKNRLPMGGRAVKMAGQEMIDLHMVRAVARFDVINTVSDLYDLNSVTIYAAGEETLLWYSSNHINTAHTPLAFYGTGSGSDAVVAGDRVVGGLYAFENFAGTYDNYGSVTALVVELSPKATADADEIIGVPGQNYFYRVDIRPEESAQNLMRNNVYVVSLLGVLESGKATADATFDKPGGLDVSINNWSVDDEGMVVTDGQSTMAISSKFVRFGPLADTRTYDIFTVGPGELSITHSDLPTGLSAELDGRKLTVTALALPEYSQERSGTIELGYGGLRGKVTVVQTPVDGRFIELDKTSLAMWDSFVTGDSPAENIVTVSASGEWTAKIYNTSADEQNPGFAFNDVSGGAIPDTEMSGMPGQTIQIYSTGPNTTNDYRQGFMIVALTGEGGEEYSRAIVLTQNVKGNVRISPVYAELPFDPVGAPSGLIGTTEGNYYKIDILPGSDNPGDPLRAWKYELSPAGADQFFKVIRVDDRFAPYILVSALGDDPVNYPGLNMGATKTAQLTISLDLGAGIDDEEPIVLDLSHETLVMEVNRISALQEVPVTGTNTRTKVWSSDVRDDFTWSADSYTDYVEYEVEMSSTLKYRVDMIVKHNSNSEILPYRKHEPYFIGDNGKPLRGVKTLTDRDSNKTIRIGYDKIYYPMVHYPNSAPTDDDYNYPEVELTVSIPGVPEIMPESFTVKQAPLMPVNIDILMASNATGGYGGYGSFSPTGSTYAEGIRRIFMDQNTSVNTGNNFGPGGIVRTNNNPAGSLTYANVTTWNGPISVPVAETRNFINAGSHNSGNWVSGAYQAVETWRRRDDTQGILYFTGADEAYNGQASVLDLTSDDSTIKKLGWQFARALAGSGARPGPGAYIASFDAGHAEKRVMKYVKNGPFGAVVTSGTALYSPDNLTLYMDDIHSALLRSSLGPNAVVIFTEMGSGTNGTADNVLLVIDPVARFAFLGESTLFGETTLDNVNERRMLGNVLAIYANAAQYGDHFLELLYEDCEVPLYLPGGSTDIITAP